MKIETLVDVINYERGVWQCDGDFNFISTRFFYGSPTYYRDRPSGVSWTREEFEKEVAELSAADWIYDRTKGGEMSPPAKSDQVHQPKHYEVVPGVEAKDIIKLALNSDLTKDMTPWQIGCFKDVLKYRLRAGKKDNLQQDIDKANEYVTMGWSE